MAPRKLTLLIPACLLILAVVSALPANQPAPAREPQRSLKRNAQAEIDSERSAAAAPAKEGKENDLEPSASVGFGHYWGSPYFGSYYGYPGVYGYGYGHGYGYGGYGGYGYGYPFYGHHGYWW